MTLEAPFAQLLEDAFKSRLEKTEMKSVEGELVVSGTRVKVMVRVRGNSSLGDMPFPKLKVESVGKYTKRMNKAAGLADNGNKQDLSIQGLPGVSSFKINTHGGEIEQLSAMRRLLGGQSPVRESLAYEWARVLGVPVPATRVAQITYIDISTKAIVRDQFALVLEDGDDTAKRFGGKLLDGPVDTNLIETVGIGSIARVLLFENLVGNWDQSVNLLRRESQSVEEFRRTRLWNVDRVQLGEAREILMPGDFDMASLVTGDLQKLTGNRKSAALYKGQPDLTRYLAFQIFETRRWIPLEDLKRVTMAFGERRGELDSLVDLSYLNEEGKQIARAHLESFFGLLDSRSANSIFKIPVIKTRVFEEEASRGLENVIKTVLPPGTPLEILGEVDDHTVKIRSLSVGGWEMDVPKSFVEEAE